MTREAFAESIAPHSATGDLVECIGSLEVFSGRDGWFVLSTDIL